MNKNMQIGAYSAGVLIGLGGGLALGADMGERMGVAFVYGVANFFFPVGLILLGILAWINTRRKGERSPSQ